jgi:hypothetical protein
LFNKSQPNYLLIPKQANKTLFCRKFNFDQEARVLKQMSSLKWISGSGVGMTKKKNFKLAKKG